MFKWLRYIYIVSTTLIINSLMYNMINVKLFGVYVVKVKYVMSNHFANLKQLLHLM